MFTKLIFSSIILCSLVGCGSSQEQKNAESIAKQQDAEIFSRKDGGEFEMYAELNSKERRWVESNMRQTNSVTSKKKDEAYVLLTEKMSQGSWVWKKETDEL